jgi:hypothetical protein
MTVKQTISIAGAVVISAILCLAGCGGSKVLKNPEQLRIERALASTSNHQIELILDLIIVRDGPGTWAKNADWDEYLLRVRNLSNNELQITGVAVYDSLGARQQPQIKRAILVDGSRAVAKRYKSEGLRVKAGLGGTTLLVAGGTAYVAGAGLGAAALAGGSSAVAGAAVIGIVAAPALAVGGIFRAVNNSKVADEIVNRNTPLPVNVAASSDTALDLFFSLAPSPRQIEVSYTNSKGEQKIVLNTQETLKGLHIVGSE